MFQRFSVPSCAQAAACLMLAGSAVLAGCAGSLTSTPTTASAISVSGNWQIASTAASAAQLAKLSGTISGSSASIKGVFHSDSASACVSPSTPIDVTGSADANNLITLTGGLAGGTFTLTGTLAADGKSITNAQYNVTGGTCAFVQPAGGTAMEYADITGTYNGSFYDGDSATTPILTITAQLSQSPTGDTDGNFTLTGTATVPQNPCFANPPSIVNSQVTGGSFTFTYADSTSGNSVTATGTFSTDGTTLTVSQWTLAGPCGGDTGYGTMTKQ